MADNGYKDTKVFICTGCGCEVVATKFASQKSIKCQTCKENKVPTNPDIVTKALIKNPQKSRHVAKIGGDTKECKCIKCGNMVTVTKFASPSKVLCPQCKGEIPKTGELAQRLKPNMSKLDKDKIVPIEEYEINDGIIENKRLREVPCPACGKHFMKPIMIIDWSQFGMVIKYQCQDCLTTAIVSEQARRRIQIHSPAVQFDYTGREIEELGMKWNESSRIANALCRLIDICKEHNIDIDKEFEEFSSSVPKFKYKNDIPTGFTIPPEEKLVNAVQQAVNLLDRIDENNPIPQDLAINISEELKGLLKGDKKDAED